MFWSKCLFLYFSISSTSLFCSNRALFSFRLLSLHCNKVFQYDVFELFMFKNVLDPVEFTLSTAYAALHLIKLFN